MQLRRLNQVHPRDNRRVTLAVLQRHAGRMQRIKGRRARRVNDTAWTFRIEDMANAVAEEGCA
jgi:hypothetical protein